MERSGNGRGLSPDRPDLFCGGRGISVLYAPEYSCGREALEHLEEVVNWLQEQENIKVRIQLLMKRLGHLGKYSLYDYLDNLDYLGERSNRKIVLENLLYLPFLLLLFVQPAMGTIGIVLCMLWHIMTYFREKK